MYNVSEQEIRKFAQRRKSFKNQSYLRKITQTLTRKLPHLQQANINSQNKYFQFIMLIYTIKLSGLLSNRDC